VEPLPEDWGRVLAVVAHPDDLEYGVASAIARWTQQGKHVVYVLATSGEAGIQHMKPEECGPLREDEERRSAAVVGVRDVEFLGHADGVVEYGLPLRRDLAAAIRRHRPDTVVTINFELAWGNGNVNHADHRAVGLAVLDACRDAANPWCFPEAGEAWGGVHEVYVAASEAPTHYVDVTDTIELGIASLQEHRAYIEGLGNDFDPASFLDGMATQVGEAAGVPKAVAFRAYSV
jgi:LmbE family N-acetylglucosaminyl deacetylase